ncbi:unnamed protein product [Phytophthora fragariaefolia]|uniref:Unnamed protein product n=1 Tax=Phytophthora fragariaefolia TaxID=1490495 RepID=A0A9W6TGY8_9STRA|nr:unnamed protein product [Phytophthora fragariaefolia]
MALGSSPTLASELTSLPALSWKRFARDMHDGRIEQISILSGVERMENEAEELKQLVTVEERTLRRAELGLTQAESPLRGPARQVKAIDDFFESRRKAGQVRESKSPHSAPTFCVKKAQGGWRIVHAYNKLNDAMVLAQTPIPRKDVIIDSMALSTIFSALDLRVGFYQIFMRESDIPLAADGVRPDPGKVRVINGWPTPSNVKELRQLLGLATYLCKYVSNYAGKIRPLSQLLKKDAAWDWTAECQQAFDAVKQGLTEAPILAVADQDRPFHVVCDASDFAIGCALIRSFVVYTDHASLRTAIKSPHISQRMARWLSFFAEYNFQAEYKPGRLNVVADALSRRPDYAVHKVDANAIGVVRTSTPSSPLLDDVRSSYATDADAKQLLNYFAAPSDKSRQKLAKHLRARVRRYRVHNGLLLYNAVDDNAGRVVVPNDRELKLRITYEYHDAPTSGHLGREKTYLVLTRDFYWSHQYKWVRNSKAMDFVQRREAVIRFVLAIAASVGRQKLYADNNGRGNTNEFKVGSLILLATQKLAKHAGSDFGESKLVPRFIDHFTVLAKHGNAYTLDIPSSMRLHPTFYVRRLKSYSQH